MTDRPVPSLSVIVVGNTGLETLAPILACLRDQTIAQTLEIVAVVPVADPVGSARAREGFGSLIVVAVGAIGNRGIAAAAGVRVATAPIVAFTENHCFPDADWAQGLLAAHDGVCAGVAPAIANANPESLRSWAVYALSYAQYHPGRPPGIVDDMPLHNTSYRRALLMARTDRLEQLLAYESLLQADLRADGHVFRFVPTVIARHINEVPFGLVGAVVFCLGWRYGGARAEQWPPVRRGIYAAAFPILSLPITRHLLAMLKATTDAPRVSARLVAATWFVSMAHATGEVAGYMRGPRSHFDIVDRDEFMVAGRLGGVPLSNSRLARYVAAGAGHTE